MDIVSHGLVGALCRYAGKRQGSLAGAALFGIMPDIPVLFVYALLGRENGRRFWIPQNSDWDGVREAHPIWTAMWDIPTSLTFFAFIVIPVLLYLRLPWVYGLAYLSHVVLDVLTHTGEWAVRVFYPVPLAVEGFTDAWSWHPAYWLACWAILAPALWRMHRKYGSKTGVREE